MTAVDFFFTLDRNRSIISLRVRALIELLPALTSLFVHFLQCSCFTLQGLELNLEEIKQKKKKGRVRKNLTPVLEWCLRQHAFWLHQSSPVRKRSYLYRLSRSAACDVLSLFQTVQKLKDVAGVWVIIQRKDLCDPFLHIWQENINIHALDCQRCFFQETFSFMVTVSTSKYSWILPQIISFEKFAWHINFYRKLKGFIEQIVS